MEIVKCRQNIVPRPLVWGFRRLIQLKLCLRFLLYDTLVPQLLWLQSMATGQAFRATSQLMEIY